MSFWIGVLAVAVGLLISIGLHEIGHLVPAKKFGVRVPQYFVGFGPTVWSRRRGETEYGVKAIPLGGFVRMVGMFPPARNAPSDEAASEERLRRRGIVGWARNVTEDARAASLEELQPGDEKRAFYQLSTPKKITVMMGGPVVNLVLSALLFTIVFSVIGVWVGTSTISSVTPCLDPEVTQCSAEDEVAPSAAAGFEPGDVIVSWGGTPIETWSDVSTAIADGGTEPAEVVVERDGTPTTLTVTPALVERTVHRRGRQHDDGGGPLCGDLADDGARAAVVGHGRRRRRPAVHRHGGRRAHAPAAPGVDRPVGVRSSRNAIPASSASSASAVLPVTSPQPPPMTASSRSWPTSW